MSLSPLGNPWRRVRAWAQAHRAQAEIMTIAGVAIGLIILMLAITIIVIYRTLR